MGLLLWRSTVLSEKETLLASYAINSLHKQYDDQSKHTRTVLLNEAEGLCNSTRECWWADYEACDGLLMRQVMDNSSAMAEWRMAAIDWCFFGERQLHLAGIHATGRRCNRIQWLQGAERKSSTCRNSYKRKLSPDVETETWAFLVQSCDWKIATVCVYLHAVLLKNSQRNKEQQLVA